MRSMRSLRLILPACGRAAPCPPKKNFKKTRNHSAKIPNSNNASTHFHHIPTAPRQFQSHPPPLSNLKSEIHTHRAAGARPPAREARSSGRSAPHFLILNS